MASGSVMACCINSLLVQGETLVWHTGLPREGEQPRTSPPFSYRGREYCLRFWHRDEDGDYHSLWLHRLDADGAIEESDERLTHRFRVHVQMLHLTEGDEVVGHVEDWNVRGTPEWLWGFGKDSEAIFRRLDWLRDRPEVKIACRFPTPPTIIPTDEPAQKEEDLTESSQSSDIKDETVHRDDAETEESQSLVKEDEPRDDAKAVAEESQSTVNEVEPVPRDDAKTLAEDSQSTVNEAVDEVLGSLRTLYQSGEGCDVVLKVGGKEFPVHRLILEMRSPVFRAMFQHDMLEKRRNTVDIEDCDRDTFPAFLEHVYTGGVGMISGGNVFSLFAAADKYDFKALKKECSQFMKRNMTVTSFCDVIRLAVQHGEKELVEQATQFFCSNSLVIVQTPEWQVFLEENPTVGNELVIKLLLKHENIFGGTK